MSVKKDDRASDAIINLSGLMRYVIKDANDYKIPLDKEIEYITNYVELQKARLGNTAGVYFECLYSSEIDNTYILYSGTTTLNVNTDYFRIDGPPHLDRV